MTARYRVRWIRLSSLAQFGCLLGVLIAFVPSVLCGLTGLWTAGVVHGWLEGLRTLRIDLPPPLPTPSIDGVHLLHLDQLLLLLRFVDSWSPLVGLAVVLALSLLGGAVLAAILSLAGLGYNLLASLLGGVEVELNPEQELPAASPAWIESPGERRELPPGAG